LTQRTTKLRALAKDYYKALSKHPVLSGYWSELSVVVKGSTARGNTDRYSDVDVVVFCNQKRLREIIKKYNQQGLTNRTDGIFLHPSDWNGHYNLETYEKLSSYLGEANIPQVWEYQHALILHDPQNKFKKLIDSLSTAILADPLPLIKRKYLDLQLTLDWVRQPLLRGDAVAAFLHCARITQDLCRISYLLDGKCFPHDKWLFHYVGSTRFGKANKKAIAAYTARATDSAAPHKDLWCYPQYAQGTQLIAHLVEAIRKQYGDHPWLAEWYFHV
jgi:hypothetical protein